MQTKQDWLVSYIVNSSLNIVNSEELQNNLHGMTATEILAAMDKANDIWKNLNSTDLGKELA